MSSRARFEQSQTEPMETDSRANLRAQNRKNNFSELRIEPPEEEDSKKTQIGQIYLFILFI